MSTIVIYESATGFTKRYAQWIAEALQCDCKELKQLSLNEIENVDRVIFGGWIMGSGIMGLEKLRGRTQPFAVFAVGSSPAYEEVISVIKEQNKIGDTPLFYMEGGFQFEKLGFAKKTILKMLKKAVAKKENPNRQEAFMAQALGTSFDHSGREQILPLIEYCNK